MRSPTYPNGAGSTSQGMSGTAASRAAKETAGAQRVNQDEVSE